MFQKHHSRKIQYFSASYVHELNFSHALLLPSTGITCYGYNVYFVQNFAQPGRIILGFHCEKSSDRMISLTLGCKFPFKIKLCSVYVHFNRKPHHLKSYKTVIELIANYPTLRRNWFSRRLWRVCKNCWDEMILLCLLLKYINL